MWGGCEGSLALLIGTVLVGKECGGCEGSLALLMGTVLVGGECGDLDLGVGGGGAEVKHLGEMV